MRPLHLVKVVSGGSSGDARERSTRNTFRVNLWHDGIFLVNPLIYSCGDFRVINDVDFEGMTYSDFFAIILRLVLVSPVKMFYKTPEMINNELNEDASVHKSSSDLDSFDDDYDPLDDLTDLVDFQTEGNDNLDIPKITTNDSWLNKLVGKGNFIGYTENPKPLDGRFILEEDDPDEHLVDQKFKLKNCLANYGVKNGYQLWYMQNDSSKLLVKCGRDVSKGKCAGMKGKKPNPKPSVEEPKVCFTGLRKGWLDRCRRVIGLDGCFLTHTCKGQLLTAMGRDANNQMFPIAWAVVSVENKNNWCWFLSLLHDDLSLGRGSGLTIISDAHKGLIEAVASWFPNAEHRQCTRHIYANFKRKWSGLQYKRLFWIAAATSVEQVFLQKMEEIKLLDVAAFNWLVERNPNSWSRTYFEMDRCTTAFENGISESFNSRILGARGKPIITMLEDIRIYLMQRMWHMNKKASDLEDTITPSVRRQLEHLKIKQRFWLVFPSAFQEVEVRRGDEAYGVNLNTRKCSCRMWELSGIPCVHAVAAYTHMKMEPELGVSQFYSKNKWLEAYQHSIRPVPGSKLWKPVDFPKPLPPIERKMPRRPRKVRIRHPTENDHEISRRRRVMHCHKCWEVGHNKSTCTNPKIPKPSPSTAADGGTETPVPKPTSLKTATAAKTGPPSSPPVMPPEGPPEPRSSVVGRGKCQLKPINKSGVGNTMAKNHGKTTITKNQGKASGAVKKGTGEYQMEMDYEALAAVEAEQATKDAEQEAMRKIWEEQMYENDWPGVEYVSFSDSDENATPATPSNPTTSNLSSVNPNTSNPTSAKSTSIKPTSAKPTPRTRSKRKQPVNPAVPRVFVKQRGRSERIAKMQGKNLKFDEKGTGSTPDKAFPVSESESE
ncbi:splicing factor [Tanacetum coccineum]